MAGILAISVFLLLSAGVYLITERTLFRVILGLSLLGHAANLIVLSAGGVNPIPPVLSPKGNVDPANLADPLPQALILTAIVISMAITLYLLALMGASSTREQQTTIEPAPESDEGRARADIRAELEGEHEGLIGGERR